MVILLLKSSPPLGSDPTNRTPYDLLQQTKALDFIGAIFVAGAVTCLSLALQWGGNTKPWNDKAVIVVSAAYESTTDSKFSRWPSLVIRIRRRDQRCVRSLGKIFGRSSHGSIKDIQIVLHVGLSSFPTTPILMM